MGSDGSTVRSAPVMQRLVRGSHLCVGPAVDDYRRLASRRRHASDIAFVNEGPDHPCCVLGALLTSSSSVVRSSIRSLAIGSAFGGFVAKIGGPSARVE